MKMPVEVKSAFYCVSLRTGLLMVGYFFLVAAVIGTTTSGFSIAASSLVHEENNTRLYDNEHENSTESVPEKSLSEQQMYAAIGLAIDVVTILFFIGQIIVVVLLIVGIHQGKAGFIKGYLVYTLIMPMASVVLNFLVIWDAMVQIIIASCICYALEYYSRIVIRNYMSQLKESQVKETAPDVYKAYNNPL